MNEDEILQQDITNAKDLRQLIDGNGKILGYQGRFNDRLYHRILPNKSWWVGSVTTRQGHYLRK